MKTSMKTILITRLDIDTAACKYAQDDKSTEYYGLKISVIIEGVPRILFLRTSEAMYPGNEEMIQILTVITNGV